MIRPLGFLDVARLSGSFTMIFAKDMVDSRDVVDHDVRHFWLRHEGRDVENDKPWKAAKGFLTRLRNEAAPLFGNRAPSFGDVFVRSIAPGGRIDWHTDPAPVHRVHICLNPSPGGFLFSGGMSICPAVGNLLLVEHRILHSAINLGPCPLVELVTELVSPDQGETDDDAEALVALEA